MQITYNLYAYGLLKIESMFVIIIFFVEMSNVYFFFLKINNKIKNMTLA
jgi:hypothetical protein